MKITRRALLRTAFLGAPVLLGAHAFGLEPEWLRVRRLSLATGRPTVRLAHFTDVHFKGDEDYLRAVVGRINALAPDLVCFTGDIIEEAEWLKPALALLAGIKAPLFGVPGNHDHWSGADFGPIRDCFRATGGAWLENDRIDLPRLGLNLIGLDRLPADLPPAPGRRNVLLAHYPEWADKLGAHRYDLILAGHTHGGQVRLPFYGPLIVPFGTGAYDLGLFATKAGPLYVNPGIGHFYLDVRFNCRPEITLLEL